jgi:hypothetical protein
VIVHTSSFNSVSCASPGFCAAAGLDDANSAFLITEWHGTWGKAITPAGIPKEYRGIYPGGPVSVVACPPRVERCVAGGFYQGPKGGTRAFLVSQAE